MNFRKPNLLLRLFLVACSFWISASEAQTVVIPDPAPPGESFVPRLWPESFFQSAIARSDELQYRFTDTLFNGDFDTDIFHDDFSGDPAFAFNVNRDVYNNFDVLNTWTVIDSIRVRIAQQITGIGDARNHYEVPIATALPFAGLSFGVNGALELRDVRQLARRDLTARAETPSVSESNGDIQDVNPYLTSSPLDSPLRMRVSDLLNPFKIPFKIPLSRRDLKKLEVGEMVSYDVTGEIGFGGSIGWKMVPTDLIRAGVSVSVETHLKGEYQISILKESERYAKIRVSKLTGKGRGAQFLAGLEFNHLIKGFFLFNQSSLNIGSYSPTFIPFQFKTSAETDHQLDIAYRYDLDSEAGKDAFHRAVLGSFVRSEEIALEEATSSSPSVTRLFTRNSLHVNHTTTSGTDLFIFLKYDHTRSSQNLITEVVMPDGTSHVFRSVQENDNTSHGFLGNSEKRAQKMTVLLDREGFLNRRNESLMLMSENIIEDSATRAKELNEYTQQIQNLLHESGTFPAFPDELPPENHPNRKKQAIYGKSSFYFGYTLKENGVKQFLHMNWDDIEYQSLRRGITFDRKAYFDAREAYDARNPEKTYDALSRLFSDRKHITLVADLLISSVDPALFEKFLIAQNPVFGSIQNRGNHLPSLEDSLNRTETLRAPVLPGQVANSHGSEVTTVDHISTELGTDHKLRLHFHLTGVPKFVYFRMTPISRHRARKEAIELIVFNRDQRFKTGDNVLVLDPASTDTLEHKLSSKFSADELMVCTVGLNVDGAELTYGSSIQFKMAPAN